MSINWDSVQRAICERAGASGTDQPVVLVDANGRTVLSIPVNIAAAIATVANSCYDRFWTNGGVSARVNRSRGEALNAAKPQEGG